MAMPFFRPGDDPGSSFPELLRRVGLDLGLDREFVVRQPFPGPGLAVRIVGAITRERLAATMDALKMRTTGLEIDFSGEGNTGSRFVELTMIGRDGRFIR